MQRRDPVGGGLSVPAGALAEPARARMVDALLDGRSWPATDLARVAGVAPSTASGHLAVLVDRGLVTVGATGRHRYYTLAGPDVARAVEALQAIAPPTPVRSLRQHRASAELRAGRTCYDHLAGDLGLRVADLLTASGCLEALDADRTTGLARPLPTHPVVAVLGIGGLPPAGRRPVVRGCLDWTGRRPHVAGLLGAHLLEVFTRSGWIVRRPASRAVRLTGPGEAVLAGLERV